MHCYKQPRSPFPGTNIGTCNMVCVKNGWVVYSSQIAVCTYLHVMTFDLYACVKRLFSTHDKNDVHRLHTHSASKLRTAESAERFKLRRVKFRERHPEEIQFLKNKQANFISNLISDELCTVQLPTSSEQERLLTNLLCAKRTSHMLC